MKKEDLLSTFIMTTVSIVMLVGVTIAWYTAVYAHPTVTGMNMTAADNGSIKIALKPNGPDLAELENDAIDNNEFVEIGLEELLNIVNKQMAPGAYGEIHFYLTSLHKDIVSCQLSPYLIPGYEKEFESKYSGGVPENATVTINNQEKVILEVLEEHFDFYSDKAMTVPVTAQNPMEIVLIDAEHPWNDVSNSGEEITVTLYWKWHYEDPQATADSSTMSQQKKEAAIYDYDMEDTWIGTHLDTMRFHFTFMQ